MKKIFPLIITFIFSVAFAFCEKITFSASSMTGQAGNSNTTTSLKGNAYIKTDTMEIYAEEVELSGKDFRYIKAKGKVVGKNLDSKMDFFCDSLEYDREEEIATLNGSVIFKDVENDVEAEAQIIEYNQKTEIVILQVKVKLTQEDNICTGSYGIYFKGKQILELSGNAQVKQKDDTFRAQHITLNLDTQEITLGGNVKGSVTDSKVVNNDEQKNHDNSEDLSTSSESNNSSNNSEPQADSGAQTKEQQADSGAESEKEKNSSEKENSSPENKKEEEQSELEDSNIIKDENVLIINNADKKSAKNKRRK